MFDPEYTISLYLNGDETLTQSDIDKLSDWIEKSHENASVFIQASLMLRSIKDNLSGNEIKNNALSDMTETIISDDDISDDSDFMQALRELAEQEATAPALPREEPEEQIELPRKSGTRGIRPVGYRRKLLFKAACVIGAFVLIIWLDSLTKRSTPDAPPMTSPIVASLSDQIDAAWDRDYKKPDIDGQLPQDTYRLAKGYVSIKFNSGAKVTIEAPAKWAMLTDNKMELYRGSLYAIVSENATGFTIKTPNTTIIDRGTEFGVKVDDDSSTDIHMIKGWASLVPRATSQKGKREDLVAGDARQVSRTGHIQRVRFDELAFKRRVPSPYELAVLASDPICYWRFDDDRMDRMVNALGTAGFESNYTGQVWLGQPGPNLGDGKPNKALRIDGDKGVAIIDDKAGRLIKAEKNYSIAMWVYPEVNRVQNIFVNTNEEGAERQFSRQVYLGEDGRFGIYTWSLGVTQPLNYNREMLSPLETGQWYHLVAVFNEKTMALYVNGKLEVSAESPGKMPTDKLSYIGCSTGKWHKGFPELKKAAFKGCVDEISQYDRSLSARQVEQLYRAAAGEQISR